MKVIKYAIEVENNGARWFGYSPGNWSMQEFIPANVLELVCSMYIEDYNIFVF